VWVRFRPAGQAEADTLPRGPWDPPSVWPHGGALSCPLRHSSYGSSRVSWVFSSVTRRELESGSVAALPRACHSRHSILLVSDDDRRIPYNTYATLPSAPLLRHASSGLLMRYGKTENSDILNNNGVDSLPGRREPLRDASFGWALVTVAQKASRHNIYKRKKFSHRI